jgi:rfaE bifunctional protein nucleotidyltransferase chain/domain/rfaE bifunctional protein kinase chain/domain
MTAASRDNRRRPHVVVVGDVLLDRDLTGTSERLAPDAPVPVLDVTALRESPGGAGLAALLAVRSGARVTLIAPIADDAGGAALLSLLSPHLQLIPLGHQGLTRRKTRVRSGGQSLLRIDDGGPGRPTDLPVAQIGEALADADAVLVADYGAGTTTDQRVRRILTDAAAHTRLVWDPHPRGGPPVAGATLVTPNLAEAAAADRALDAGSGGAREPDLLAGRLRKAWRVGAVCVTAGADGAFLAGSASGAHYLPAPAVRAGDSCGAGDRFAASATVRLAFGDLVSEAAAAGVRDASAWVGAGGSAAFQMPPAPDGSVPGDPALGDTSSDDAGLDPGGSDGADDHDGEVVAGSDLDIVSAAATLEDLTQDLRDRGARTVVATGGCFDIVHPGHVATLQAARRLGDALVVLINSDASVARLKGPGRPVVGAADRARVLQAFDCVDAVVVFDEDDPRDALSRLRPDIWVKGGDYGGTELPETATVEAGGGRVVFLPYLAGRSTTSIIERSRSHSHQSA